MFAAPRGHKTHPMSDRIRGALFNTLGDISGLTVLDAFAGSGALSIEAVSRGASVATAIDSDISAQKTIRENIRELGLARKIKLITASANAWLSTTQDHYDLVLCDPPYHDQQLTLISRLADRVAEEGLIVTSLPPGAPLFLPAHFQEVARKSYGDAELAFYRRIS
jgi:16S rRNA (guanine966-N2)-methyltransferase